MNVQIVSDFYNRFYICNNQNNRIIYIRELIQNNLKGIFLLLFRELWIKMQKIYNNQTTKIIYYIVIVFSFQPKIF